MAQSIGEKRPLSPHLQIYRLSPTMAMSIAHRVCGAGLYFGMVLLVWWLAAAAAGGDYFAAVNGFFGSWFGRLVLFGFTFALIHHMLGGIRHLVWDTGRLLEKNVATRLAWATIGGSSLLTILIWIVAYSVR